jgi:GTP-binding protein hflX
MEKRAVGESCESRERVALVGIQFYGSRRGQYEVDDYLDELSMLVQTAGGEAVVRFTQKLGIPDSRMLIGKGKAEEIASEVKEKKIDAVIFDEELTPSQQRNLEAALQCRVLDRTGLILDIFAQRARSAYAKTQVELAQYQYLLPRLAGMWTHLERQHGGIGSRGPGEREIETDRRIARARINKLKQELARIDKQMATQRKLRNSVVRVALVGYTNVGKSTLLNRLTGSSVYVEHQLFATLDPTVRKVTYGSSSYLLADTVGFIRKLPTQLVEAFKSTLDEVRESDILLHVVDLSHPAWEEQMATVNETLREIGAADKTVVLVFNKIDRYNPDPREEYDLTPLQPSQRTLKQLQDSWMGRTEVKAVFISAMEGINLKELRDVIEAEVTARQTRTR